MEGLNIVDIVTTFHKHVKHVKHVNSMDVNLDRNYLAKLVQRPRRTFQYVFLNVSAGPSLPKVLTHGGRIEVYLKEYFCK